MQININNNWTNAIVVDEGLGKEKMSIILEDDDTLQIIKVSSDKARAI